MLVSDGFDKLNDETADALSILFDVISDFINIDSNVFSSVNPCSFIDDCCCCSCDNILKFLF